jgi:uncharacterized protein (TIGR04222 family)
MFPFDLDGPRFLLFYAALAIVLLVLLHRWLRHLAGRQRELPPAALQALARDPYGVACLRAGPDEAARVAVVCLIDRQQVERAADGQLRARAGGAEAGRGVPLERAVLVALSGGPGSASDLPAAAPVRAATAEIEQSLQRSGLVISDATDAARRRARRWVLALLLGLAAARVAQTLLAGNSNLMFLVLMSLLVLLIGSMMGRARLTRSGTRCLDQLRVLLADLARQGDRLKPGSSGRDMALLAAMFGIAALPAAAYPYAAEMYPRSNGGSGDSGSSSAGDGGSSCSSSCGSGCGGGSSD